MEWCSDRVRVDTQAALLALGALACGSLARGQLSLPRRQLLSAPLALHSMTGSGKESIQQRSVCRYTAII